MTSVGALMLWTALAAGAGQADTPLGDVNKASALWAAHKPPAYEFTIEVRCFCVLLDRPVSFRVQGDQSTTLVEIDAATQRTYAYYDTIDKLLEILRKTAARDPYKMVVSYDPERGYPMVADLDPKKLVVDDELYFRVTAFKPLPAPR